MVISAYNQLLAITFLSRVCQLSLSENNATTAQKIVGK